jgi:5-methylcytosine-specific restriction endonuclease McrA
MAQAAALGGEATREAGSWRRAHEELVRLARTRAGLDWEEGGWLLRAFRAGAHVELGYGAFNEYAERLFGYGPRLTQEKLRVAEALEGLPATARELQCGSISFSAARELTRVAIVSTEREWLDAARGRTVREVEHLVSGHSPGSRPDDAPDARAKRHVLRLEVSGEALAIFRDAMAKVRREAGGALDEDAAILLLCRNTLEGPRDAGRSSYQVALTVCERCRQGMQHGRGELVEVAREVVEMAECDGQELGSIDVCAEVDAHVGAQAPPAASRAGFGCVRQRARSRVRSARGKQTSRSRLPSPRAKQTVPPALRREVWHRDGGRCRVPGCRHATFVDVHHLRPRAEGGANTLENLVILCGAHHRALHAGRIVTEGTPSTGLTFRHADGTAYGRAPSAAIAEARAKAFSALTQLGFRESEVKRALARVACSSSITLEELVRDSLRELAPKRD